MPRPGSGSPSGEPANRIASPRRARCEIIDVATREVWQDVDPTPRRWWGDLTLEPPLAKAGYGSGNMDRTWFRRSPDAGEDGPVRTREIAGRQFFFCARPVEMQPGNPRFILVEKHHTLGYDAGRDIRILTTAEGRDFVLVVDGAPDAPEPALPDGWRVRELTLEADWIVDLPAPTETYWFEGMVSYQGPLGDLPGTLRDP